MSSNPYWERISALAAKQRNKGIEEYGRGIEEDTADINVRLDRIEEELIDALMYIEHLRDCLAYTINAELALPYVNIEEMINKDLQRYKGRIIE